MNGLHSPSPLHHRIFTRSPARPRKTNSCPENGSSASCVCTSADNPRILYACRSRRPRAIPASCRQRDHRRDSASIKYLNMARSARPRMHSRWPPANSTSIHTWRLRRLLWASGMSVGTSVGVATFTGSKRAAPTSPQSATPADRVDATRHQVSVDPVTSATIATDARGSIVSSTIGRFSAMDTCVVVRLGDPGYSSGHIGGIAHLALRGHVLRVRLTIMDDLSVLFSRVTLPYAMRRHACGAYASPERRKKKRKGPSTRELGPSCLRSLAVTYSGMACSHTTIGAGRFHFRVRNGIGWFPLAIAARQTGKLFVRRLSRSPMLDRILDPRRNQLSMHHLSANALRLYGQASRAISTG